MKQQFKPKTIATMIIVVAAIAITLFTTQVTIAQQQSPNIPPPKVPLTMPAMPGDQYAKAMINELNQRIDALNHRLGNNTAIQHAATILKQMTAEGKIDCPTPFSTTTYLPQHCYLAPRGHVITGPTR
jgi:hypothetical protein